MIQLDIESNPSNNSEEGTQLSSKKHDAQSINKSSEGYGTQEEVAISKPIPVQFIVQNKHLYWTTKVIIVSFVMLFVYLGKKYGTPSVEVKNLQDPVQDATTYLNNLVNTNKHYAQFFQISASIMMDFTFFVLCTYWVLKVNTGRMLYALGAFYAFRALNQALVIFPFPEGYYWEYPGFPSYVTPYGRTSDFFYSGHVGFLNICAMEWYKQNKMIMAKLTWGFDVYIAFVMIIFRIHYAVDITTGLVVSHWLFMMVSTHAPKLDALFRTIYSKAEPLLNPKSAKSDVLPEELEEQA